jgi:uncharacterized iron-regulated protein
MFRIAALTAVVAVTLTACASAPAAGDPATIAPFETIYDVAWVRSANGSVRTLQEVADDLSSFDVVFFGEYHGHSGNHLAQMKMFQALHERFPGMTLSLEQFERDTQPLVDRYLRGEIGEAVLDKEARAWPNYETSYRPLVEYAAAHGLPVVAANAPKNIVICVGKKGLEILDEIPPLDRSWVAAELHVDEGPYLDKYIAAMGGGSRHGGGAASGDDEGESAPMELSPQMRAMVMRSFAAQVTRDDTMAESIARHLQENPGRKILHLDGNFHSASHLGTVERLKLRMPELKIAVINPIAVDDNNAPSWTEEDSKTGDYLLLVHNVPEQFVSEEKEMEFQMALMRERSGNTCEYATESEDQSEN